MSWLSSSPLYRRILSHRGLVRAATFAITGELTPRRHRLLAQAIHSAGDRFVLDLGCGEATVLRYVSPDRYVGLDGHRPSLEAARAEHGSAGREFIFATIEDHPLGAWPHADTVVVASVCHHLDKVAVLELMLRIWREVGPRRILVQDAEPIGFLGPVVTLLDDGDHLRPRADLVAILNPDFLVAELWTYVNPLRSFRQFLLELRPREAG